VKKGRDSIVKFLVEQGANVNAYATPEKITCLMLAAEQDNVYICEQLLSQADDKTLEAIDASGCTALHHAVSGWSKDTFE
jgi:ankyrin repeat protein